LIFGGAIVDGIVFICSFLICSFLVYRKGIDFFKFILCIAAFLKLFMVSRNFGVEFFGSANRDTLIVSLLICNSFISSSCLIALAKNSRTM
jgi:hypothetical protein